VFRLLVSHGSLLSGQLRYSVVSSCGFGYPQAFWLPLPGYFAEQGLGGLLPSTRALINMSAWFCVYAQWGTKRTKKSAQRERAVRDQRVTMTKE
jgi:hypothetical protein